MGVYNYSPIKKIYIKNFRNIGEAEIDFTESPIVSLIGENEAGKTSVVKAFSVCALHSTPRDQKDYIRDGTAGFGVAIELQDGTMITRIKTKDINRYEVKYPDGKVWEASKLENIVPKPVQDVLGLLQEPETKEYLQIRTYEDQLLFVVTPASTNYKVMYEALKVDALTRAIKMGSKEANDLKLEINATENGISTLTANLRGIRTYDITPLLSIKSRLEKELRELERIKSAVNIARKLESQREQLGALSGLLDDRVSEVSEMEVTKITQISRIIENIKRISKCLSNIKGIETLEDIDLSTYTKLNSLVERKRQLETTVKQAGALVDIGKAEEVNEVVIGHLIEASNSKNRLDGLNRQLSCIDPTGAELIEQSDLEIIDRANQFISRCERNAQLIDIERKCSDYCTQMENYLKSIGVSVEICPRCGESVVIDISKYSTT